MTQPFTLQKVWRVLISKRLAVVLITLVTITVTGQVLFQAQLWDPAAPALGMQTIKIYKSPWFSVLASSLLVNLFCCTANSFYFRLKSNSRSWSLWGSTIFHAGLATILIGTLITGYWQIFCSIKLIQGEPKSIPYQALLTEATSGFDATDRFGIVMHKQRTVFLNLGMAPQTFSTVEINAGQAESQKMDLTESEQLRYRDIYLYPNKYGYAVRLKVLDEQGQMISRQTVPLDTNEYSNGVKSYNKTNIRLDALAVPVQLGFYPGTPPQLELAVKGGDPSIQKTLSIGEGLHYGKYSIIFEEIIPWTELFTAYDPGAFWVFVGIGLALFGQAVSLLGKPAPIYPD